MVRRVLGVMVAGTLLAAAPASAAELQAAYDYYEPGQGFQIGLEHAATGAALALPRGREHRRRRAASDALAGRAGSSRSRA